MSIKSDTLAILADAQKEYEWAKDVDCESIPRIEDADLPAHELVVALERIQQHAIEIGVLQQAVIDLSWSTSYAEKIKAAQYYAALSKSIRFVEGESEDFNGFRREWYFRHIPEKTFEKIYSVEGMIRE